MSPTKITDKALCEALCQQDRKAFDTIYERYWKRLYRYAFKILEDQLACEDIVQEVFLSLWESAQSKEIVHLEAYLFRAVKFQVLNMIRNLKQTSDLETIFLHLPDQLGADHFVKYEEVDNILKRSVHALPEKCKEVFRLSRDAELSNQEIAMLMNISVRTVEAHLYKALKSIKKNLGQIYVWLCLISDGLILLIF
ncbi:RNA polymerase sigma-70 factor [Cyclobacterium plantarum]|uniref:RNA polymerase sigma-70 factor n=1 Tax=Cyclobacterium plantarum TaxID=2716263 RepID=A0ABX0H5Z6_9BACT|nr:RNA polymerase sigma-70 factor [Cyclobacterium plantarum]NHE57284.1 RNA polymerase sigma-70 factor [Cyclobacterium plantarum]